FQPLILQVQQTIKSTKLDLSQAQSQQQSRGASAGLAGRIDTDKVALTNLQQSQISLQQQLAAQSNSIISLNPARHPAGPSSPRPLLDTILAALLGLMIGVGSLLLTDYLDDSPRSPEHLSQELGAPIFASLPRVQRKAGADLEVLANPHSDAAEAYRILRTSIRFANVDAPIHSVLVTSAGVGEGKTTTACNLAVTFAQAGVRVVLIDADLRRPSVHRALHLENSVGLTSVLCAQNDVQWSSVLQPGPVAHLHVLTAGPQPPNPAELLSSRRMRRIMEHLSERADLVIVDAPPLLAVADPAVLSLMTDSALLVTDVEETSLHALQRARESLAAVGASISGIVLNKVPRGKHAYYHYYGEGYYSEAAAFEDASPRLSIEEQAAASGS
ncbi:MAG: polysaccharide biosynthesis tyrosine autokinase, partial [Chloroflexota bacterium]